MMFTRSLFLIAYLVLSPSAQEFEAADFDGTEALLNLGVDVSSIPPLTPNGSSKFAPCHTACSSLEFLYGASAVDVKNGTAPAYSNFTGSFWSTIQAGISPYCIFKPPTTTAVSVVVLLSRLTQCPFAVKSGGHAAFAGASSIQGGITVSLENLDGLHLAADKKTVAVQPGNTWHTVYSKLAKSDLSVIGGRDADIGVGGLTTGGGISFFSSLYGFACDNVASYDVVTASGVIVTATPVHHPDLYWSLRGGGNNFGIVVSFNLETIPLPNNEMWGGTRVFAEESFPEVVDAFTNLIIDSPSDPNAGTWCAWVVSGGAKVASTELWYAKPNGRDATIFDAFNNITAISDTTQNRTLVAYTEEVRTENPDGYREVYYVMSTKASAALLSAAKDMYFEEVGAILGLDGAHPSMIFQGVTEGELAAMKKNGGNPLGLNAADGPFFIILLSIWWDNEEDDDAVYTMASRVFARVKTEAVAQGSSNDYAYMNYGSQFQDVIGSYGAQNKARLKSVAQRYDPKQVFQLLQPGYFKLDQAPVPDSGYFSF